MRYMIQVAEAPSEFDARSNEHAPEYWAGYAAYSQALRQAGVSAGGAALKAPDTARTVRTQNGALVVQDGPYADVKEQLGGFFIIEAENLDAALDWAARCPSAAQGAAEIRPVIAMDHSAYAPENAPAPTHCFLLYDDEPHLRMTPAEAEAQMGRYMAYTEELVKAGVFVGGEPLEPRVTATTLRLADGARRVEDGPYADTKETLGGYYLIRAGSDEEAMKWAKLCPCADSGVVEVRPKLEISMAGTPA